MNMHKRNRGDMTAYHQKYFRPSCLKALNLRFDHSEFYSLFFEKTYDQIQLPYELTRTPEDTLINYFSILLEAENIGGRSCGTVGQARTPFPIAYNFLSQEYQNIVSYEEYFHSFAGIGHTSLIKLIRVPDGKRGPRFFYEIETIEGSIEKKAEYFGYSYGFIELVYEQDGFRISDLTKIEEDFLCAPYHGWDHDGLDVIGVKYGNWCHLIHYMYPTVKNGFVKYISFHGKDGRDYCFMFVTLTNGTDVEIAQFRKRSNGRWKQVKMIPEEECTTEEPIETKLVKVTNGEKTFNLTVHVADTPKKRDKGLMFVEDLPINQGMLFVFSQKTYGGFWMKNTFIPLSIAFLDSNGKILKIVDMVPCKEDDCPTYDPKIYYHYTLEVNLGWFAKNQIKKGDFVVMD
ncbi:MAG: hypothetical protein K0Q87_3996 [Neobacillus sp.]|nr:hypothetical protein [Neobacillus sp.]